MSKLGFGNLFLDKNAFFIKAMEVAKDEFRDNFANEANSESGQDWQMVKREIPPPILNVTGTLEKSATRAGDVQVTGNTAKFEISAVDNRNREYASFHQESPSKGNNVQREYVTQSEGLTDRQIAELDKVVMRMFK